MRKGIAARATSDFVPRLLVVLLAIAAGCARTSGLAGKGPAEIVAAAEQTLKDADQLGADQIAPDAYGKAQQRLAAARTAHEAGNARRAAKQGEQAYALGQRIVERARERGEATVLIRIDPAARDGRYSYHSLAMTNHLLLMFEGTPEVENAQVRGPLGRIETRGNVVDLGLAERVYVREIKCEGDALEILAARRGAFWPVIVCIFADTGVAYHMNRGDPFRAIDILLFLPYIHYVPRIINAFSIADGAVGVADVNEKTGFRKDGDLGKIGARLTVRCRFLE